jgi:hypothetical protein
MIELKEKERKYIMKDLLMVIGIVVVWFVLNRYILPRLGVNT